MSIESSSTKIIVGAEISPKNINKKKDDTMVFDILKFQLDANIGDD